MAAPESPSWCIGYQHITHSTQTRESIELWMWPRSLNYAAGVIIKRCNRAFVWYYASYSATARRPGVACHPLSAYCNLHREVHWSTLCTSYVQHSQEFHTRVQHMCDWKVGVPKSWLHRPTVLYPLPATFHNHLKIPRVSICRLKLNDIYMLIIRFIIYQKKSNNM